MSMIFRRFFAFLSLATLLGCAGNVAYNEGLSLVAGGRVEEGLDRLNAAVRSNPTNAAFRASYLQARDQAVATWLNEGERAQAEGNAAQAEKAFQRVLGLDSNNARAKVGLENLSRNARYKEDLDKASKAWTSGDRDTALALVRGILTEFPQHRAALAWRKAIQEKQSPPPSEATIVDGLKKPLSIEFKDTPLKQVFEVLARTSGFNFIFDKDIRTDQRTTIFLRNSTVKDAINMVCFTNQLEQRVLDKNSILIYPNTAAKVHGYQPLMAKSFFLNNSDVKTAANTLKTILKTKDVVVDERQNMIIMRDTPEAIRLAERLIALHDLPEPEVMLEVAVLEVSRTRLLNLGVQWPNQLALTPLAATTGGTVTLADLRHTPLNQVGANLTPSLTINAQKQDGDANLLANPRIRARSKENAKVLIGQRVPNITTTSTATGFVGETVQYVDIGLKLDVQPTIYPDNEIAIKLSLEVSSIINQVKTQSGTLAYEIGTRSASTVLRLKDGENQVLAGLINAEERSSSNKVPGLGEIPIVGRLFGSQSDNGSKTEIVLSITPHLVRNIQRPALVDSEFDVGTEGSFKNMAPAPAVDTANGGAPLPSAPDQSTSEEGGALPLPPPLPAGNSNIRGANDLAPVVGNTSLSWQGPAQVKIGGSFTAVLAIQPNQPLTSIPYSISYDPKVLEVLNVSAGDFLKQGGGTTSFSNRVDRAGGQIMATETRSGADGASTPGVLAAVVFRALAKSNATQVQLPVVAPIGLGGRNVNVAPTTPLFISVQS